MGLENIFPMNRIVLVSVLMIFGFISAIPIVEATISIYPEKEIYQFPAHRGKTQLESTRAARALRLGGYRRRTRSGSDLLTTGLPRNLDGGRCRRRRRR